MKVIDLLENNSFVINLPRDKERLDRLMNSFDRHDIKRPRVTNAVDARSPDVATKIDALIQSKHTVLEYPTEVACAMSHIALLSYALKNDLEYITVFEDDVTLCPFAKELSQVELPAIWDVLYLGHCPNHRDRNPASICPPYARPVRDNWVHFTDSSDSAFGMYGYAIHRRVMKHILDSYTFQCAVDYHLMRNHGTLEAYGLYPCLVVHDYNFGSYSNPLRTESYTVHFAMDMAWPLLACSALHAMMGFVNKDVAVLSLLMIVLSLVQGFVRKSEMEARKRTTPNFPGIYGCDSYAPFVDVWSVADFEKAMAHLKALPWADGLFVWGHTLLGLVRDGKPIAWEPYLVVAKPRNMKLENVPFIKFTEYEEDGPWLVFPSHRTLKFNTRVRDGIGFPEDAESQLKRMFTEDCLDIIRSPSHVEGWGVPISYWACLRRADLSPA